MSRSTWPKWNLKLKDLLKPRFAEALAKTVRVSENQGHAHRRETGRAVAATAEEMQWLRTQMEEVERAKERAEGLAEAPVKTSEGEDDALKTNEDMEKAMDAAREEAEQVQQAVDEQLREAEAINARAEEIVNTAAEEVRKAKQEKQEAEERWKMGIQPVSMPSSQDVAAAKTRIQYREGYFHFAVAGISGSGKSSLVNAFRGLRNSDSRAAAVGVMETTLETTRYQDTNPDNPLVWYDIPGAGTLRCPGWQYFHDQGLYVFDCIILLIDGRFTMMDLAILTNARRFNIPTYIVRSKADQHIRNTMMEYDTGGDKEEGDAERRDRVYKAARKQFVDQTRKSVQANLEDANLAGQRVYIVSNNVLLHVVMSKVPKNAIDEVELVNDLVNETCRRREIAEDERQEAQ